MSGLAVSPEMLASLVIALSFAAGLNVYATVFSLGVMARMQWVELPAGLESIAHPWIMAVSGIMFAGEFVADKIPGFDLFWNALHTFVRIPVAALLAYGAGEHLSPEAHLLVTCLGAAIATLAHGSKTAVRVAVTPSPEPVSNIALSTVEDGAAVALTWVATHHPLAGGLLASILSLGCIGLAWWSVRLVKTGWRRLIAPRQPRVR